MSAYQLKGLDKSEPIDLDFTGVKVMAPSWADEVVIKLVRDYDRVELLNTENASAQATLRTLR